VVRTEATHRGEETLDVGFFCAASGGEDEFQPGGKVGRDCVEKEEEGLRRVEESGRGM